ncbi:hypothetical protein BFP97_13225 [Roseivirga sp. 4D4]|uniref:CHAT domain-containing protein n=1 Tax=Roseivirga sp. 4D4 TaxID=1889784 RepID=UPI00085300C4|nr:CHAT domain-containing tetratricopeptide repeat protein [Roseivirga sp. 4D4]OEK02424.1 hypothetical protein BFP97_13225 [Roseivirga sp. 4D4]
MKNYLSRIPILLLVLLPLSLTAQNGNSNSESAIKIGRDLLSVRQYDSAIVYFEKAIELASVEKDSWTKTIAQSELGRAWIATSKYDKALEISNSILSNEKAAIRARVLSHQNIANFHGRNLQDPKKEAFHNHQALKTAADQKSVRFENPTLNDSIDLSNRMLALEVLGEMHRERQTFDSAQYYVEVLIDMSEKMRPQNDFMLALHKSQLANIFINQRKVKEAKNELLSTLPIIERISPQDQREHNLISGFYSRLGVTYNWEGKKDSSLLAKEKQELFLLSAPLLDSLSLAQMLSFISVDHFDLGNMNAAMDYREKSMTLKKKLLGPDHPEMAVGYKLLGLYGLRQSDRRNDAVEYFRECLRINLKLYGKYDRRTVDALHHLAYGLNILENYEESLTTSKESLAINKRIKGSDFMTAAIYTSIAFNLTQLKRFEESIAVYRDMISLIKTSKEDLSVLNINSRTGLALIHEELEEYDKAEKYLREAAEECIKLYGPEHRRLINIYYNTSNILEKQGLIEESLEFTKKSLELNLYNRDLLKSEGIPLNLLAKQSDTYALTHRHRTLLFYQKGLRQERPDFGEFWKSFDISLQLLNELMNETLNSSDLISLQTANKNLYSLGMNVLWLSDSSSSQTDNTHRMWQFSESSKGVTQKLNEKKRQTSYPLKSTDSILEEQKRSMDKISYYKSLVINGNEHDSVRAGLFQALEAKKESERKLKTQYPKDYSLSHIEDDISFDELTGFLGKTNNILDYFISEENIYAFLINNNGLRSFKFDWSEELQNDIISFKKALVNDSTDLFRSSSHQIYTQIFEPVEPYIDGSNLIIIPDKDLWNLNFDLLLTNPGSNEMIRKDYLIQKYAISYSHSTGLLLNSNDKSKSRNQVLAFSYADNDQSMLQIDNMRDAPKNNLPGTARELKILENSLSGKFYYGEEASESQFKESASNYAILHMALHGEVDGKDPDNSKLYFTGNQEPEEQGEDNALHTFELYNIELNAELAVLSACNTGNGKINDGEGVMSLGKAFRYAGVNSVLLSQWEVSDATTPEIMEGFYKHLQDGKSKSEALRQAKLEFLDNANNITANPYYWGSFFIIGNPDPIDLTPRSNQWYWLVGLVLLGVILVSRKRFSGATS